MPSRANALIGLCTVQKCLERLVCDDGPACAARSAATATRRTTISDLAPEVSRRELLKCLDEVKQTQAQGTGASQRAQVAAAVGLVLDWIPEQVELSCASAAGGSPVAGPTAAAGLAAAAAESAAPAPGQQVAAAAATAGQQPPPMALPPPLLLNPSASFISEDDYDDARSPLFGRDSSSSSSSSGSGGSGPGGGDGSPSDEIWTLRNMIHGAWRLCTTRADIRQAATAAMQQPELADWIRHVNTLPMCVLGVAMLKAAALKLELEDSTDELMRQYCYRYQISPTTAEAAATRIAGMMDVAPATTMGLFGDGIF